MEKPAQHELISALKKIAYLKLSPAKQLLCPIPQVVAKTNPTRYISNTKNTAFFDPPPKKIVQNRGARPYGEQVFEDFFRLVFLS